MQHGPASKNYRDRDHHPAAYALQRTAVTAIINRQLMRSKELIISWIEVSKQLYKIDIQDRKRNSWVRKCSG
jgi:hypothetical protein